MPIPFTCPHCGVETNVAEQYLGTSGPCAHCGQTITIPAAGTASPFAGPAKRSQGPAVIIILVLVVLGVLVVCGGLLVAPWLALGVGRPVQQRANINAAKAQIGLFETELRIYQLDTKWYPTTDQGLEALRQAPSDLPDPETWNGPYLQQPMPLDPWGNPYQYESPGKYNPDSFDIWSFGPDMTDGTEDDIGNWEE